MRRNVVFLPPVPMRAEDARTEPCASRIYPLDPIVRHKDCRTANHRPTPVQRTTPRVMQTRLCSWAYAESRNWFETKNIEQIAARSLCALSHASGKKPYAIYKRTFLLFTCAVVSICTRVSPALRACKMAVLYLLRRCQQYVCCYEYFTAALHFSNVCAVLRRTTSTVGRPKRTVRLQAERSDADSCPSATARVPSCVRKLVPATFGVLRQNQPLRRTP
jgi:hypothetical protein